MRRRCADRATTEDVSERRLANGPARTEPNRKGFFFFFLTRAVGRASRAESAREVVFREERFHVRRERSFLETNARTAQTKTNAQQNEPREGFAGRLQARHIDRPSRGVWRLAFGVWVFLSERLFVATLGFGCVFRPLRADSSSHVSDTDRLLPRAETLLVAWGSPSVARRRAVRGRVPSKKIF